MHISSLQIVQKSQASMAPSSQVGKSRSMLQQGL